MKKILFSLLMVPFFLLAASTAAHADWEECGLISRHPDTDISGSGTNKTVSVTTREYASVGTDCIFDSHGAKIQFQAPGAYTFYFQDGSLGHFVSQAFSGTEPQSIILTDSGDTHYLGMIDGTYGIEGISIGGFSLSQPWSLTHFQIFHWADETPSNTATIVTAPATKDVTVGSPFAVDIVASSSATAFNAAQATITLSSNLSITNVSTPVTGACNLNYTQTPSISNASFAGGLFGGSATSCKVYTLTLIPTAVGTGTVTITNGSLKSFDDHSELLTGVTSGTYTIAAASPAPSPNFSQFTIDTGLYTYGTTIDLGGSRNASLTEMFINGSSSGINYPTSTSWMKSVGLTLGANTFDVYGEDASNVASDTQSITIHRHTLGDINGDSEIDLVDASLFAVDWGKTSGLTYVLSDMNNDGTVNLTDLSILAKLIE